MAIKKKIEYWGEITLDEMHRLNNLSEKIGWRKAVSQVFDKNTQEALLNEQRADWKYLTGVNLESKVLDVGCGFGSIAYSLAHSSKVVYALEPVWERIRFVNIRIKQENIQNIKPICANALSIPFPDNFFDLVILNGVLEWAGYLTEAIGPDRAQKQVLKEISRVIKPTGALYIAIENRFAFFYFLGVKDPHTGLPFINLMPRCLANLYHYWKKKQRHCVYLYSYSGYKRLLRQAGFKKMTFYTPLPSYRNFHYIFPLNNIGVTMNFWLSHLLYSKPSQWNRRMKIFLSVLRFTMNTPLRYIFKFFTLDYSIVASKEGYPINMLQSIAAAYNTEAFSPFYYKGWRKRILFYFRNRDIYPSYVWKVADNPVYAERLKKVCSILSDLSHEDPAISGNIPKILYQGYINNEFCMLQSVKSGTPLVRYLLKYKNFPEKIDYIFTQMRDFLISFYTKRSIPEMRDMTAFSGIVYENLKAFKQLPFLDEEERQRLHGYIEEKISSHVISSLPVVIQHNDLQPINILYNDNNTFAILDWEYGYQKGLPLIDLLHFLFLSVVYMMHREGRRKQRFFHPLFSYEVITDLVSGESFDYCFYQKNIMSDLIKKHIDIYCATLSISRELRQLLFLVFILQSLDYKKDFMSIFLEKGYPQNL